MAPLSIALCAVVTTYVLTGAWYTGVPAATSPAPTGLVEGGVTWYTCVGDVMLVGDAMEEAMVVTAVVGLSSAPEGEKNKKIDE